MTYPSDLSDAQGLILEPRLPHKSPKVVPDGSIREPSATPFAIHSKPDAGVPCCPANSPPMPRSSSITAVGGVWERINQELNPQRRQPVGKPPHPEVVAVDSQSVKTTEKTGRFAVLPLRNFSFYMTS